MKKFIFIILTILSIIGFTSYVVMKEDKFTAEQNLNDYIQNEKELRYLKDFEILREEKIKFLKNPPIVTKVVPIHFTAGKVYAFVVGGNSYVKSVKVSFHDKNGIACSEMIGENQAYIYQIIMKETDGFVIVELISGDLEKSEVNLYVGSINTNGGI